MTATTEPATAPSTITLPTGWLACQFCGQAVAPTDQHPGTVEHVVAYGRDGVPVLSAAAQPVPLDFATCPTCRRDVLDRADALLAEHPELARRHGDVARHRLTCALAGLAAIGHPALPTATDPQQLILRLTVPGAVARWLTRFAPMLAADAVVGTAAAHPWTHLTEHETASLRAGWAALLRDRVAATAPPVRIPPPASSAQQATACAVCGVGAVVLDVARVLRLGGPEQARNQLWRAITLPMGADRVSGFLCPHDAELFDSVGSVGPTLAERSLVEHLDATGRTATAARLRVAFTGDPTHRAPVPTWAQWVTRRPGTTPSAEPWGWLALAP